MNGEISKWVVFDAEANGLRPSKFYCLAYKDFEGKEGVLTEYEDIRSFFSEYEVYVGHNCRRWDLPQLRRVVGIILPERIIDTLGLSWYLEPERGKAGLESYGEDFGIPKPVVIDWTNQTLDSYIHRCQQDVEINHKLWKSQLQKLLQIYDNQKDLWRFFRYLDFKMYCAALQEESRWKLDVDYCKKAIQKLEAEFSEKERALTDALPKVPITTVRKPPARPRRADGELSAHGIRWQSLLERFGLPEGYDEPVREVTGYSDGNPNSTPQIKDWLYSLGWKPKTIKVIRDKKTGKIKEIPQIMDDGDVCESIQELYDKAPELKHLESYSVIKHRLGILRGFLRDVDDEGYLYAGVQGLTNTLRFRHAVIVNLPKTEKEYGEYARACLVATPDHELCGSDMSGLEDRLKQHFLFPHDPDYVRSLLSPDYDPHLDIAVLAGMMTNEDAIAYKNGDYSKKSVRSTAKNGNYACQYGAGVARVAITCGIDTEAAKQLHRAYWERNWAIKKVASLQKVKRVGDQLWLFNPITRFWYSLRTEKDIFSTLVQGSAAYCFDTWVGMILADRPQLTAQFHDEIVLEVRKGFRDEIEKFLREAISETNEFLKLNRELDIDVQFGNRYSEIH